MNHRRPVGFETCASSIPRFLPTAHRHSHNSLVASTRPPPRFRSSETTPQDALAGPTGMAHVQSLAGASSVPSASPFANWVAMTLHFRLILAAMRTSISLSPHTAARSRKMPSILRYRGIGIRHRS